MSPLQIQSISKQEIVPYKILFDACLKKLLLFENTSITSQSTNTKKSNSNNAIQPNQNQTNQSNNVNSENSNTNLTSILTKPNQKVNKTENEKGKGKDVKKNNSSMEIEPPSNVNSNTNTNKPNNKKNKSISVLLMISVRSESPKKNVLNSFKQNKKLNVSSINISENSQSDVDYEMLSKHDVIFFFSNSTIKSCTKIGNMLAKFVENGGGVVVCSCAALAMDLNGHLTGRIVDEHFLPMFQGEFIENKRLKLGKVEIPEHPIMDDVKHFDGGKSSFHISANPNNLPRNSKPIALWEDGNVLISEKQKHPDFGKIVVLNIFPISGKNKFWNSKTDGAAIICNSIEYVSKK
ncbi:swi/snf-related matrix-associated actin-dependent regulator of chromatin subfamily e member 1 [Anaeramoeba flamelloides]|uniref:Swi/snf-related matrix-associated actin-dependent regulator of chromatin subfamily e member 1 n=1 Tax=Anaeramoeba flamelloides TaxID=1746091 RepID=A0ABQ8Y2K2_9EUKA|nr:swi/snf-related matrix-associated actin-dependent regulator of chromatin subfamily e member 1 [Anaeramoeba flamelloides]